MKFWVSALVAVVVVALIGWVGVRETWAGNQQSQGSGTCKYTHVTTTSTSYSTNIFKVIITIGGFLGSTQTCSTVTTTKTIYKYQGPPLPMTPGQTTPTTPSGQTSTTALSNPSAPQRYKVRILGAEAACYGNLLVPEVGDTTGRVRFMGIDGQASDLSFRTVHGPISYFLGTNFDRRKFDPAWVDSDQWTGVEVVVNTSSLKSPTMVWALGGDTGIEAVANMDLSAPDAKVLTASLGSVAANAAVNVVVSATAPGDGALLVVDGVTIPIVPDAYTQYFLQTYPQLQVTADPQGNATIYFPLISDPALDGKDLFLAAAARDASGTVVAASTWVSLQLRDTTLCR